MHTWSDTFVKLKQLRQALTRAFLGSITWNCTYKHLDQLNFKTTPPLDTKDNGKKKEPDLMMICKLSGLLCTSTNIGFKGNTFTQVQWETSRASIITHDLSHAQKQVTVNKQPVLP